MPNTNAQVGHSVTGISFSNNFGLEACREIFINCFWNPFILNSFSHGKQDSIVRSTCGTQRKLKKLYPVTANPKCQRCQAEREGRAGADYHKPHQREKPDCRKHNEPVQKKTRIRVMKPSRKTPEQDPEPGELQAFISATGAQRRTESCLGLGRPW